MIHELYMQPKILYHRKDNSTSSNSTHLSDTPIEVMNYELTKQDIHESEEDMKRTDKEIDELKKARDGAYTLEFMKRRIDL